MWRNYWEAIHAVVGNREVTLIAVTMLIAGLLSAFMNNIAATAVLMPAIGSMGRRAGLSPSRLFMPLAFGAILGGTMTSVGTPPNIMAVALLQQHRLPPFQLFDFTPLGLLLLLTGIAFMVVAGRHLIPDRNPAPGPRSRRDLAEVYELQSRLFSLRLPHDSPLQGASLAEARLGTALGVQVIAILRDGEKRLAPDPSTTLSGGDVLLVEGELSDLRHLLRVQGLEVERVRAGDIPRPARGVSGIRLKLHEGSAFAGHTLSELHFRERFQVVVVGIVRKNRLIRRRLAHERLCEGDEILAAGTREAIPQLALHPDVTVSSMGLSSIQELQEDLFLIRVPPDSLLAGSTIRESRIGELAGITVSAILREDRTQVVISPDEVLTGGDRLLVSGEPSRILHLLNLGQVELDEELVPETVESNDVGMVEATLAPRSSIAGQSLRDIRFRERYGLQVLAIWREKVPIHTHLADQEIRVGDALLLQGPREKIRLLASNPEFLVLASEVQPSRRTERAPHALFGLTTMILMVVTGFQPIQVAAFTAATIVLLLRALTMEEAYRAIDWRTIFLVAAVLPMGTALEESGAAALIANTVVSISGPLGPYAVLATLGLLSSLLSQGLDGGPAVVLLTPVTLDTSQQLAISPYPLMMIVSLAASAAFMTPFSHKANLLVMGAGGYRPFDYVKVGTPLTVIILLLLILFVPILFPF